MYTITQNITEKEVQVVKPFTSTTEEIQVTNTSSDKAREDTPNPRVDEQAGEDKTVENLGSNFPNLSLKDNTNRYVITEDGVPQCYTHTIKDARKRMWDFARLRRFQETQYNCYIREGPNLNDIQVIGCNRFYAASYDRTICWLNVCKIQEIEEMAVPEQPEEDIPRSGLIASIFG